MKRFDHLILGTGQATGTLLGKLIPGGDSIAVVEGGKVGGSCVNYGCTPTKTLVASARAVHLARSGDKYGFSAGPVRVRFDDIRQRMEQIRDSSRKGLEEWMEESDNVTLIREWGRFTGPGTIEAGGEEVQAENIYINVGTRSMAPPVAGLDQVEWMDNAGLLDLKELPEHLLVIGGGYIGVEFAQVFRRFGSEVTLIQRSAHLMPREDPDVSDAIREFLEAEGIEVLVNARAQSVNKGGNGPEIILEQDGSERSVTGTHLLVAAGRQPNSDLIDPAAAGIETDQRGYIQVDDQCRTSVEGVFAVGDVNGKGAFTHTSVNDAEIVLDHLFGGKRKISDRLPIYGLFTDPPLGRVGLTEKEALEKGCRVLKSTRPMSRISRAREMGETTGFAKLLVDAETDMILGAAVLGPGGDEIINMFAAIMHSRIPCREYRRVVLVHPTVSELMPWMLDGLEEVTA